MALQTTLLLTTVTGSIDWVATGIAAISALLTIITGLIIYIWSESKKESQTKHNDLIDIMNKFEDRQKEVEKQQAIQRLQIIGLNGTLNVIQGKPLNYDNTAVAGGVN